jgi:hypothetical protein
MPNRRHFSIGTLALMLVAASARGADCPEPKELDTSIILLNFQAPLISAQFAEQIATSFFQTHYSANVFKAKLPATTNDLGDRWSVTFENTLFDPNVDRTRRLQIRRLGIEICKSNGAIVRLT